MNEKKVVIIAGPNGAGKTTFAKSYLVAEGNCPQFINADLIAAGLSPFAPETAALWAGRLMLEKIAQCEQLGESFAIETTLAGRSYLPKIRRWRISGYRVELLFLMLRDVETAIDRVAERVRQGGHNIPEPVIRRRFGLGFKNFQSIFQAEVDHWMLFDCTGMQPIFLDEGANQ